MQEEDVVRVAEAAPGTRSVLVTRVGHQKKKDEVKEEMEENQSGRDEKIQERVKGKNLKSQKGDEKESKSYRNEHLCWK